MSYGLLSALSWGISALLAAAAARCIGALRTVVIGEAAGLAGYLTLFGLGHFSLRGVGNTAWLLVLAGVIAVVGYLAMYRGLESGHVGLVSAITACYGGVIAVLSVVLLRERLTVAAAVGIAATVVGVVLAVLRRAAASAPGAPPSAGTAAAKRLPGHPADRRAAGLRRADGAPADGRRDPHRGRPHPARPRLVVPAAGRRSPARGLVLTNPSLYQDLARRHAASVRPVDR